MDGRIVSFLCLFIGLGASEYSERPSGATSFAQVNIRQYEPEVPYRRFGSFPKEAPAFQYSHEKKFPFPIKSPVEKYPIHNIPKPFPVPVATQPQIPFALDRPVAFPVKVIQPIIPTQFGKAPFNHFQPYQHQDSFNQPFHQHLQ